MVCGVLNNFFKGIFFDMKILAIGDLHCRPQYIQDFYSVAKAILKLIDESKPDKIVLLGDMLHNHSQVHTDAYNAVYRFVKSISDKHISTYILVGNHDYRSNSEFLTENHPYNPLKLLDNVFVVDKPYTTSINLHAKTIGLMPYVPPGRFNEAFNQFKQIDSMCLLFAHQEFKGASFGAIKSEHGDEWSQPIPIVSGHIHDKQIIKNIMYVGTPYMTTFGESEDKTVTMFYLDIQNEKVKIKKEDITLDVPKRLTIYASLEDYNNKIKDLDKKHYYRLTIKDDASKVMAFKKTKEYKDLSEHFKVVLEPQLEEQNIKFNTETYLEILKFLTKDDDELSVLLTEVLND